MTAVIMEMSEQVDAIAKVLPKAQASMGEVFKTANNPAFRSKYADLAAVVEAVLPALNAHGISLLQPANFDGERVCVGTMLLHESGQWVRCSLSIPLAKKDAHGIGSAVTYGRRFGLQAMSGVAPVDDDGNAAVERGNGHTEPQQQRQEPKRVDPQPPTLEQRAERLATSLTTCKPEEVEKVWKLAQRLRDELAEEQPGILDKLTKTYEFRRPEEKAAA